MSDRFEREWHLYVHDMISFCEKVIATRNKLIHEYLAIDDETLWSIISSDVGPLHENLLKLMK